MRQVTETATTLTIHEPLWLGLAVLLGAYGLAFWFLKGARTSKKPVQQRIAGFGGLVIGTIVGLAALLDRTTLDATGVRDWQLLAGQRSAAWKDVVEVSMAERRVGRRGQQPHLVLRLAPTGEVWIEISGLDGEETARVLAFAKARAGK